MDIYKKLAKLTKHINFGCKKCGGSCCKNCEEYVGHLDIILIDCNLSIQDVILYYAEKFDLQTGFRRENGCILPRHRRSVVCLTYACSKACGSLTDTDLLLLDTIRSLKRKDITPKYAYKISNHLEKLYENKK